MSQGLPVRKSVKLRQVSKNEQRGKDSLGCLVPNMDPRLPTRLAKDTMVIPTLCLGEGNHSSQPLKTRPHIRTREVGTRVIVEKDEVGNLYGKNHG